MENLTVKITYSIDNNRNIIPAGNLTIRKVEYVSVTKRSGKLQNVDLYPDQLPLCEGPLSAKAGINTQLWFAIKIAKNAPYGNYSAILCIENQFWKVATSIDLHVWDFPLPDSLYKRSAIGLYLNLFKQYNNPDSDSEFRQILNLYYQSFKEYRISLPKFYDLYPIKKTIKGLWWDGGIIENVNINYITMHQVNNPLFIKFYNYARLFTENTKTADIAEIKNILISNFQENGISKFSKNASPESAHSKANPKAAEIYIDGLSEKSIRNITIPNFDILYKSGIDKKDALIDITTRPKAYPEYTYYGGILATYGF